MNTTQETKESCADKDQDGKKMENLDFLLELEKEF